MQFQRKVFYSIINLTAIDTRTQDKESSDGKEWDYEGNDDDNLLKEGCIVQHTTT